MALSNRIKFKLASAANLSKLWWSVISTYIYNYIYIYMWNIIYYIPVVYSGYGICWWLQGIACWLELGFKQCVQALCEASHNHTSKIIKAGFADHFPASPGTWNALISKAFRQRGAGDILRDVYQSLTADPHSLANLDQEWSGSRVGRSIDKEGKMLLQMNWQDASRCK